MTRLVGEPTYQSAAVAWLRGEDSWQWSASKFSLAGNIADMQAAGGVDPGWEHQFYNYPGKIPMYREVAGDADVVATARETAWLRVMQYAGKTAATARGLFVTVKGLVEEKDDLAELSQASLDELEAHVGAGQTNLGSYTGLDTVWGTPLGDGLVALDEALRETASDRLELARDVMYEGVTYFVDHIREAHCAQEGQLVLPRPGVPSGTIESWSPEIT